MVFYEIMIGSQPKIMFACCSDSVIGEGSINIIDRRTSMLELSISESCDLYIDDGKHRVTKKRGAVALFMPDRRYTISSPESGIHSIISSVAVRIDEMKYIRHDEEDPRKICDFIRSHPDVLLLPQIYECDDDGQQLIRSLMRSIIIGYLDKSASGVCGCLAKWYELCSVIDHGFRMYWSAFDGSVSGEQLSSSYYYVYKIKRYICAHLAEKIRINDIAESLGLSGDYVGKIFKKETGFSMADYINRLRVQELTKLICLYGNEPFEKLSRQSGFGDFRYAQRMFRKYCGVSMSVYRKVGSGITMYHTNPWGIKKLDRDIWNVEGAAELE